MAARLFLEVHSDGMSSKGHKPEHKKFWFNIRRIFFYHIGGRTEDRAAQRGCEPPPLKVFKTGEDAAPSNLNWLVLLWER